MGRILVAQELDLRGVSNSNNLCPFCSKVAETVDHILTSCEYTKVVIEGVLKWCGFQNRSFSNVKDFIDFIATWGNCPREKLIINMILYCLI